MTTPTQAVPTLPPAPRGMQKGVPLKCLLGREAIDTLAANIALVHPRFDQAGFRSQAQTGLDDLSLMLRAQHLATALRRFLPGVYAEAVEVLLASFTKAHEDAGSSGLAGFFYLPHSAFIATFGLDAEHNAGVDPFDISLRAMRALTTRFTAEFAIRPYLIRDSERSLAQLCEWLADPNPHVRRWCSEGTRPRLPWGRRIPEFVQNPGRTLPILEALKDDPSLYVRRSVANHLGDIAKDHPDWVLDLGSRWLEVEPSPELRWVIRHALRHPAKQGQAAAIALRRRAR